MSPFADGLMYSVDGSLIALDPIVLVLLHLISFLEVIPTITRIKI